MVPSKDSLDHVGLPLPEEQHSDVRYIWPALAGFSEPKRSRCLLPLTSQYPRDRCEWKSAEEQLVCTEYRNKF
jgi:hypothetical protein